MQARLSVTSDTLRVLIWPEYDGEEITGRFGEAQGVDLRVAHIDENDQIAALLRAGGIGEIDVVTPTNGFIPILVDAGLIQPIEIDRLPNTRSLFPQFDLPDWTVLNGQVYALPFSWHTSPAVFNADELPEPPERWTDLVDPRFKGRIVMLDDGLSHFLTWNRALGAEDPARVTRTQLDETVSLLTEIKRDLAVAYVSDFNAMAAWLATEGAWVSTTGMEIVPWLDEAQGANLRLSHPLPGDFSVADCLCLATDAPRPDLAHAFLNEMISVETQVLIAEQLKRGTVSRAAAPQLGELTAALYTYEDLDATFAIAPLVGFPPVESDANDLATELDWVLAWDSIRVTPLQALDPPTASPEAEVY